MARGKQNYVRVAYQKDILEFKFFSSPDISVEIKNDHHSVIPDQYQLNLSSRPEPHVADFKKYHSKL